MAKKNFARSDWFLSGQGSGLPVLPPTGIFGDIKLRPCSIDRATARTVQTHLQAACEPAHLRENIVPIFRANEPARKHRQLVLTYLFKRYGSKGKKESSWLMKVRCDTALLEPDTELATGTRLLLFLSIIV